MRFVLSEAAVGLLVLEMLSTKVLSADFSLVFSFCKWPLESYRWFPRVTDVIFLLFAKRRLFPNCQTDVLNARRCGRLTATDEWQPYASLSTPRQQLLKTRPHQSGNLATQHPSQIHMAMCSMIMYPESRGVFLPNGMSIAAAVECCFGCQTLDLSAGHFFLDREGGQRLTSPP